MAEGTADLVGTEARSIVLDSVKPNDWNPNRLTKRKFESLKHGLKTEGWINSQPLLIWGSDEDGTVQNIVIDGEHRWKAARAVGLKNGPAVFLHGVTQATAKALTIKLDNRRGEFEPDILRELLSDLREYDDIPDDLALDLGFEDCELDKLLGEEQGNTDPDDVPEPPKTPITKLGDIWILGDHRLVCGDSTEEKTVTAVLDGAKPRLMVTDPPYGVEYDPKWRKVLGPCSDKVIAHDDKASWEQTWRRSPSDVAYVWCSSLHTPVVTRDLVTSGYEWRSVIIWNKQTLLISRGHYHWQHEPCIYGVRKGATAKWLGGRKQSTIWDISSRKQEVGDDRTGHSTQKPVECMARPIRNHEGDVYDPFLGSGSSLIAAEMNDRRCFGIELEPGWCDVIVQRWEEFTGGKAKRDT